MNSLAEILVPARYGQAIRRAQSSEKLMVLVPTERADVA